MRRIALVLLALSPALLGGLCDPPPPASGVDLGGTGCPPIPECDAPLPSVGAARGWRHLESTLAAATGEPRHRGRDLFVPQGGAQWVLAKFAYGLEDKDIKDEDIDVYLLRDCGASWQKLGTFRTTSDGDHATVEGVEDTGGRIYVDLSSLTLPLGVGRHRLHMVVAGDLSSTDQYIDVLQSGAKIAVSDIDGTLTTAETAAWTDIVGLPPPDANPGAADALAALHSRGYHVFYLTARPEWLLQKTRDWLALRGFPSGIVHTTLDFLGATGGAAATFKTGELAALRTSTTIVPEYGFGNTTTDRDAYVAGGISHAYYFKLMGDLQGGIYNDDYGALVTPFAALPLVCR